MTKIKSKEKETKILNYINNGSIEKKGKTRNKQEITLTDFYADWCEPCKIQDPIIEELKEKFNKKIKFEKLDIDKNQEIAERFKIMAVPTIIIQKNGIVVNRFIGTTSKKILENELNNLLRNIY